MKETNDEKIMQEKVMQEISGLFKKMSGFFTASDLEEIRNNIEASSANFGTKALSESMNSLQAKDLILDMEIINKLYEESNSKKPDSFFREDREVQLLLLSVMIKNINSFTEELNRICGQFSNEIRRSVERE
jgi:hypothetical protein